MSESFERPTTQFKYPDIFAESGELERVGNKFGIELSVLEYLAQAGELVTLDSDIWSNLENTDSNEVQVGDWDQVAKLSAQVGRDWEDLKNKIEKGTALQAPIVMKYGNKYHLVSGNTRLMVARAKGIVPKVLLFEIDQSFKRE